MKEKKASRHPIVKKLEKINAFLLEIFGDLNKMISSTPILFKRISGIIIFHQNFNLFKPNSGFAMTN